MDRTRVSDPMPFSGLLPPKSRYYGRPDSPTFAIDANYKATSAFGNKARKNMVFRAWIYTMQMRKHKEHIAEKRFKAYYDRILSYILERWYHSCYAPCPYGIQLDHIDRDVYIPKINDLFRTRNLRESEYLSRLVLAGWKLVVTERMAVLEKQTEICTSMINQRDKSVVSLSFHNWLRLVDDIRMGRAARKIQSDSDTLRTISIKYETEYEKSEKLLDMYNKMLTVSDSKLALERSFYHWLNRTQQIVNYQAIKMLKESKKKYAVSRPLGQFSSSSPSAVSSGGISTPITEIVNSPTPIMSSRFVNQPYDPSERIFDAPAWPSPLDIAPRKNLVAVRNPPPAYTVVSLDGVSFNRPPTYPSDSLESDFSTAIERIAPEIPVAAIPPSEADLHAATLGISVEQVQQLKAMEPPEMILTTNTPPNEDRGTMIKKSVTFADDLEMHENDDNASSSPPSSSSLSSSSSSSSSSSGAGVGEEEQPPQPLFKLSLMFFMRMRRVVRDWAQRARETVAKRHQQEAIDAAIESALAAWRPSGVPMEIVTRMSMSEALRVFRDGAVMIKRKGGVDGVDSGGGLFGAFKDQSRFFVGQVEVAEKFLVYFESPKSMQQGDAPKGAFTFCDMKNAQFNYVSKSFAVHSIDKDNRPVMKKVSKIPEVYFVATIMAIRYAIGAKVRKDALLLGDESQGSSSPSKGMNPAASYLLQ